MQLILAIEILDTKNMRKIIVIALLFYAICPAYSQTDSLFLKNYDQKILEISKLKNDLETEENNFSDLSDAYNQDTLALQKQIKDLGNKISSEKQKVSGLNKIKKERDNLQAKIDSLHSAISTLDSTILDKEKQIATEKTIRENKSREEKEKSEVFAKIVNSYKTLPFDDLIKSSTKESVPRDMQLLGNDPEIRPILNDLQIYFNERELLKEKFDADQINKTQTHLGQIKHKSILLDALKDDVVYYKDFNNALKQTISKLVDLDKKKIASGDSEIQKIKFNEIVIELAKYMYDYYEYSNYPYLSDIVLDIIKRKQSNADADINDLFIKL